MQSGHSGAARAAVSRRGLLGGTAALAGVGLLPPGVARAQAGAYPLSEFFKPRMSSGAALSPSGTRIAVAQNLGTDEEPHSAVDFVDAADPEGQRSRIDLGRVTVDSIAWANDDRLLTSVVLRDQVGPRSIAGSNRKTEAIEYFMRRVVSVHAGTGEVLWQFKTGSGIIGQPITYRGPDGKQYVAVLSGVGGWAGAVVVNDLDTRDATAALGWGSAMADLKAATTKGGTLYIFGLP